MLRLLLLGLAAIATSGCAWDIRSEDLTAFDLADRQVVNTILSELPAHQKGPFLTYTIHHLASSKAFCGDVLVNSAGREPVTIGEAIQLTIAREEERSLAPEVVDPATLPPVERYRLRLAELQRARELLVDSREMMLMTREGAEADADFKDVELKIEAMAQEIAALRKTAPAGA